MARARRVLCAAWWPAALAAAACATLLGRPGQARTGQDGSRVAYVCLGDLAVDLTGGAAAPPADRGGLSIASEEARAGCRPPHVPSLRGARALVSARTRDRSWGLAAEEVDASPRDALSLERDALEADGWRETGASALLARRAPGSRLASFEREGAWLLVVATPLEGEKKSAIVVAGRSPPAAPRRQP